MLSYDARSYWWRTCNSCASPHATTSRENACQVPLTLLCCSQDLVSHLPGVCDLSGVGMVPSMWVCVARLPTSSPDSLRRLPRESPRTRWCVVCFSWKGWSVCFAASSTRSFVWVRCLRVRFCAPPSIVRMLGFGRSFRQTGCVCFDVGDARSVSLGCLLCASLSCLRSGPFSTGCTLRFV